MNKKLIATAVVAMITLFAGTAFADPIEVNGTIKYEYRNNNDKNAAPSTANQLSLGLNLSSKIDTNTTAFGRIAGRIRDLGNANVGDNFKMDQFGIQEKMDTWNFSLGRQGAQLGQGGILYAGINIDPLTHFDGLIATSKFGEVNFKAVAGVTSANDSPRQRWYGVDFNGDLSKDVNFGVAFGRKKDTQTATPNDANYWSAYTTIKTGDRLSWTGEFVKSNADTENRAYDFSGTYSWDKNSFTVAYNHVQLNAADEDNSSIGGVYYPNGIAYGHGFTNTGYKGFTYAYHHDVRKNLGFNAYWMSLQPLANSQGTDNEYAVNLQWKF